MVFVNNQKFACEACIKGHRSSSCAHTDRPLYEVKKKGRPVSQCQKCRELRKNKKIHSKCTCNEDKEKEALEAAKEVGPSGRPKRFRAIAPALPNGLQDFISTSSSDITLPADVRQRVDTLLNPCPCKDVWKCRCRATSVRPTGPHGDSTSAGLSALARAAAVLRVPSPTHANTSKSSTPRSPKKTGNKRLPSRPASPSNSAPGCGSCCSAKKRRKDSIAEPEKGPELPPLLLDNSDLLSSSSALPSLNIPTFDTIPPLSAIQSIAGTGCTCGVTCACPGCVEHRGKENASSHHKDCADGCGTCIDHESFTLPSNSTRGSSPKSSTPGPSTNFLDAFFARAATLPQPPSPRLRLSTISLDPTNITTYPDFAISSLASSSQLEVGRAFGLVTVPRLECCGGSCGCPNGMCGCGERCVGCCDEHLARGDKEAGEKSRSTSPLAGAVVDTHSPVVAPVPLRSCCAGKA